MESAGKYPKNSGFKAARFRAQLWLDFLVDSLGIKAGYGYLWEEEKEAKSLQVVALDLVAIRRRNSCLKMAIRNIRERKKKSGFKNSELRKIYDCATELLLIVTSSLQLRFEPTTCPQTHLDVLYVTIQLKYPNSFSSKKSTFDPIKYSRGK
ncbi:hypothetical protein L3X38_003922 [Prunus dulcis]|uniref:Uncharacterized protein n=1 Tax=Prunus dulcis TaxID=3755 RepID=A0AAD5F2L5_PRUDU|nr:hypothetical protein L3X38_003922 [Prunus dulcis]